MQSTDWNIVAVGAVMICLGLLVLRRALLHDRARGRQRCPKCWYSMESAAPDDRCAYRCPECGQVILTERRLYRTHRHWRPALFGLAIIATGLTTATRPAWRAGGWTHYIPSWVLVRITPVSPEWGLPAGRLADELADRANAPPASRIAEAHLRTYFTRFIRSSPELPPTVIATRSTWPEGEQVWVAFDRLARVLQSMSWWGLSNDPAASVRLHRTKDGTPGPWQSAEPEYLPVPELWSLGVPDPADPRLDIRIKSGERVLWEGTVESPFRVVPEPDGGFVGVEDEQTHAAVEAWLREHVSLNSEPDAGAEAWSLFAWEDRPGELAGVALGAYFELYSPDGEQVGYGQLVRPGTTGQRPWFSGPIVWAVEPPTDDTEWFFSLSLVFRGDRTLALRDFDRFNPGSGRRDPKTYWSGTIRIDPRPAQR